MTNVKCNLVLSQNVAHGCSQSPSAVASFSVESRALEINDSSFTALHQARYYEDYNAVFLIRWHFEAGSDCHDDRSKFFELVSLPWAKLQLRLEQWERLLFNFPSSLLLLKWSLYPVSKVHRSISTMHARAFCVRVVGFCQKQDPLFIASFGFYHPFISPILINLSSVEKETIWHLLLPTYQVLNSGSMYQT